MPSKCEGCEGKGYLSRATALALKCQVCGGTGRGHVHSWEFRGYRESEAVRRCKDCSVQQVTTARMHREMAIKGYEAIADIPWFQEWMVTWEWMVT